MIRLNIPGEQKTDMKDVCFDVELVMFMYRTIDNVKFAVCCLIRKKSNLTSYVSYWCRIRSAIQYEFCMNWEHTYPISDCTVIAALPDIIIPPDSGDCASELLRLQSVLNVSARQIRPHNKSARLAALFARLRPSRVHSYSVRTVRALHGLASMYISDTVNHIASLIVKPSEPTGDPPFQAQTDKSGAPMIVALSALNS